MRRPYVGYDVLAKWHTPSFDEKTRAVVAGRLAPPPEPRFFEGAAFATLAAVIARIFPQDDRAAPVALAHWIDQRLANGEGDGYRHEHMPPQDEAWRRGIAGIDAEAQRRRSRQFAELAHDQQDAVLLAVQAGEVDPGPWAGLDPQRFFRDGLLRLTAALAYAHPSAWSEIGFGGPASPRGYVRIGFDEHDPWEAKARR